MKNKFNKTRLGFRIILFPMMLLVIIVAGIIGTLKQIFNYIWFGGETVIYNKDDRPSIYNIYQELKEQRNEKEQ